MSGVMRPWSHLVDQQGPVPQHEEFDSDHADVAERFGNRPGPMDGFGCYLSRDSRRSDRVVEYPRSVHVLTRRVGHPFAVVSACADHGYLTLEIHQLFEDGLVHAESVPRIDDGARRHRGVVEALLAAAVVAERRRLQNAPAAK